MIISIIACIILSICMLWILLHIIAVFRSIWKNVIIRKRKPKRKLVRKWILAIAIRIIIEYMMMTVLFVLCGKIYACLQTTKESDSIQQEYKAALQSIPFQNEVMNSTETIWEHLLNKELMYQNYTNLANECDDFDEIRELYVNGNEDMAMLGCVDVDELVSHVEAFYGTQILPITNKTLNEVTKDIPPLDERLYVDVNLYKTEFWLRASQCDANTTAAWLYQTGRAADDAFKVLVNDGERSLKQLMFFGAMAISFYLASVEYNDGNRDLPMIYYRIAEVFIYLDKYSSIADTETYKRHFLLMAEKALLMAEEEFYSVQEEKKIQEKFVYFNCYYAEILYKYNKMNWSKNGNLAKVCSEYANACIAGTDFDGSAGHCKNCGDILMRLRKDIW